MEESREGDGGMGGKNKCSVTPHLATSPGYLTFLQLALSKSHLTSINLEKMQIQFREINPFDLWIWLRFSTIPSEKEKRYVEEVFNSWFYLGKLGAFNAENLQVQETGLELSYMDYDSQGYDKSLLALMHNMSEFEYEGTWARCWFDLGTTDAIALDILINALKQISQEYVNIEELYIGGENEDWLVEDSENERPSFIYDN